MTLGRLFIVLALAGILLLGLTGGGLYWFAERNTRKNQAEQMHDLAWVVAKSIEHYIDSINSTIETMADDPSVDLVVDAGDPKKIALLETKLSRMLSEGALVRLVPDSLDVPRDQRFPRLGFADMDLIRQTKINKPVPAVHVANTEDIHIAIARHLPRGMGVILASLPPASLYKFLPAGIGWGAMTLEQGQLVLASSGDETLQRNTEEGRVSVAGTEWIIRYWISSSQSAGSFWYFLWPFLDSLLLALACYWARDWLTRSFQHDLQLISRQLKELMTGRNVSTGKARIREMKNLIEYLSTVRPSFSLTASLNDRSTNETADFTDKKIAALLTPTVEVTVSSGETPVSDAATPAFYAGEPAMVSEIFLQSRIQGITGTNLGSKVFQQLGLAIGTEVRNLGDHRIAIAHDCRPSSPGFNQSMIEGLRESGCSVVELELAPAPVLKFAAKVLDCKSWVLISGGMAPLDNNGLEIVLAGQYVTGKRMDRLRQRVFDRAFQSGQGHIEKRNLNDRYIQQVCHDIHLTRPLKVALECVSTAVGEVAAQLFRQLGCDVVTFYHDVEEQLHNGKSLLFRDESLKNLGENVRATASDVGVAFDMNGDYLAVVDSTGRPVSTDELLILFASDVLSRNPGSDIAFDLCSSRNVSEHIISHGGQPVILNFCSPEIKEIMHESAAVLAGDLEGRYWFKKRWFGFNDAMYAAARLLEIISMEHKASCEFFVGLPASLNVRQIDIPVAAGAVNDLMSQAMELANFSGATITRNDILRADFEDGYGLLRSVENPASLNLYVESVSAEIRTLILNHFIALLNQVDPAMKFSSTIRD